MSGSSEDDDEHLVSVTEEELHGQLSDFKHVNKHSTPQIY